MIIPMTRVRVLGPRGDLGATVRALQDQGVLHLVDAACPDGLAPHAPDAIARRRRRHLERALADVEAAIDGLGRFGVRVADREGPPPPEGASARLGARLAARLERLRGKQRDLRDERDALRAYEPLFAEIEQLYAEAAEQRVSLYLLELRRGAGAAPLEALRAALDRVTAGEHDLRAHTLATGETVVLLVVPASRADVIEHQLGEARVERAPLPAGLGGVPLAQALPRMRPRLAEVERELTLIDEEAARLGRTHGDALARARRGFHDALVALRAEDRAADSARAFVLEGWVPSRAREALAVALAAAVGPAISVADVARGLGHTPPDGDGGGGHGGEAAPDDAPVVLANPRLFAPFEALTQLLPLPRYGTVDPTPFVAVFFPMLFGVIVGDLGYGLVIAAIAALLAWRGAPGGVARQVAKIGAAVAAFTLVFGALYGEFFGDLGASWLGLEPLWFDRQEAVMPFLILAVSLGGVHLLLGLVVAAASRWRRDRRTAIGRGVTALMLVLVAVALLALLERLPRALLTPAVIALLVAFPVVIALEGAAALLELMSLVGHVLSYARVMALGTASVMLAVVANRMNGAFGSAAIGVAFALLFHLVNFAITLFSPTIHVMRLHYVEFFGTFFEPGGGPYQPLAHWSPRATA